jgi:hypothetical protein
VVSKSGVYRLGVEVDVDFFRSGLCEGNKIQLDFITGKQLEDEIALI